jgi:hypothetical protein
VGEEEAHTLSIVGSSYRLGQRGADIYDLQAVSQKLLLLAQGHGVGDNERFQFAALDDVDSIATENPVGYNCHDLLGAVRDERRCRLGEGAAGICHIVHEDAGHVLDGPDEDHAGDLVRPSALLMNESKGEVQAIGDGSCSERELVGSSGRYV